MTRHFDDWILHKLWNGTIVWKDTLNMNTRVDRFLWLVPKNVVRSCLHDRCWGAGHTSQAIPWTYWQSVRGWRHLITVSTQCFGWKDRCKEQIQRGFCFTRSRFFFSADVKENRDDGMATSKNMLSQWISEFAGPQVPRSSSEWRKRESVIIQYLSLSLMAVEISPHQILKSNTGKLWTSEWLVGRRAINRGFALSRKVEGRHWSELRKSRSNDQKH